MEKQLTKKEKFKLWVDSELESYKELKSPKSLETLDDCKTWFRDYKKAIRNDNVEWDSCKAALSMLEEWRPKMTKNQAYIKENSVIINSLYKYYCLSSGNKKD